MKKITGLVIAVFMIFSAFSAYCLPPITVQLNGVFVSFDQEPQIINDRTFVPVRAILEAMGATVNWNEKTRTVSSVLDNTRVVLAIDKDVIYINGEEKRIDAAPQIVGGRTLVPVRAVSESFDCTVKWREVSRCVVINTSEFSKKLQGIKTYTSPELQSPSSDSVSVFSAMYLDGLNVLFDTPDGTCIDLSYDSDTAHAHLNIRRDIYTGVAKELTKEYVEGVAKEMVGVVSGTLVSCDVVSLNGVDFMKIDYTAPRDVSGISDSDSEICVYMGIKNGIVYTATLSLHGDVQRSVTEELTYTINSIKIL